MQGVLTTKDAVGDIAAGMVLSTLLAWHQADPPDARERERNEVVYSFQGNRNPFIDQPQWATRALFESTTPASCQLLN